MKKCAKGYRHKTIVKQFPRQGKGIDAFVDASDTRHDLQDTRAPEVAAQIMAEAKELATLEHRGEQVQLDENRENSSASMGDLAVQA
jgi:hypothetical protein